jgi:hypothetical protein
MKKILLIAAMFVTYDTCIAQEDQVKSATISTAEADQQNKEEVLTGLKLSINSFQKFTDLFEFKSIKSLKEDTVVSIRKSSNDIETLKGLIKTTIGFAKLLPTEIMVDKWNVDANDIYKEIIASENDVTYQRNLILLESKIKDEYKKLSWIDRNKMIWLSKISTEPTR